MDIATGFGIEILMERGTDSGGSPSIYLFVVKHVVHLGILIFEDLIKSRLDLFLDKFFKVILQFLSSRVPNRCLLRDLS